MTVRPRNRDSVPSRYWAARPVVAPKLLVISLQCIPAPRVTRVLRVRPTLLKLIYGGWLPCDLDSKSNRRLASYYCLRT